MRFKCPKCDNKFSYSYSRYEIISCDFCHKSFRGIHCEVDMFDYCAQLIPLNPKFWYNSFFDASYDLYNGGPNFTICPKCGVPIRGFHGSSANGWWPKVCTHCCSELPTEPYFDDPPVNDKVDDKVDDKNDYKTLFDLIKRL